MENLRTARDLALLLDGEHVRAAKLRKYKETLEQVCVYCGDTDGPFELDHLFPVSRGGTHHIDNLVVSCRRCNRAKMHKTIDEWLGFAIPESMVRIQGATLMVKFTHEQLSELDRIARDGWSDRCKQVRRAVDELIQREKGRLPKPEEL